MPRIIAEYWRNYRKNTTFAARMRHSIAPILRPSGGMVDTPDLKSCELKVRAGSSPASGTEKTLVGNNKRFFMEIMPE